MCGYASNTTVGLINMHIHNKWLWRRCVNLNGGICGRNDRHQYVHLRLGLGCAGWRPTTTDCPTRRAIYLIPCIGGWWHDENKIATPSCCSSSSTPALFSPSCQRSTPANQKQAKQRATLRWKMAGNFLWPSPSTASLCVICPRTSHNAQISGR
jgi:hypothetical protein